MTVESEILGGRLPLADPTTLAGAQRSLFDVVMGTMVPWANGAGFQSTTGDGRLIGPFNPFLLNPAVASKFLDLQFAEQSQTSLSERVRQVVILAVGATWGADCELMLIRPWRGRQASRRMPLERLPVVDYPMT